MRGASVGATPRRHGGLGVDAYVQFTSPIRRYLDLVAHAQVKAFLRHKRNDDANDSNDSDAVRKKRLPVPDAASLEALVASVGESARDAKSTTTENSIGQTSRKLVTRRALLEPRQQPTTYSSGRNVPYSNASCVRARNDRIIQKVRRHPRSRETSPNVGCRCQKR